MTSSFYKIPYLTKLPNGKCNFIPGEIEFELIDKNGNQITEPFCIRAYLPEEYHPEYNFQTDYRFNGTGPSKLDDHPSQKKEEKTMQFIFFHEMVKKTPLRFQLFLYRSNSYNQTCQYLAGYGCCTIEELSVSHTPRSITMFDEHTQYVATIQFTGQLITNGLHLKDKANSAEFEENCSWRPLEFTKHSIDFNKIVSDENSTELVPVHQDLLEFMRLNVDSPFLPLLTTQLRKTTVPFWVMAFGSFEGATTSGANEGFFVNAINASLHYLHIDPAEFVKDPTEFPEVLAQVIGFYVWCCPYISDQIRDAHTNRFTPFDQFSLPRSNPDQAYAAGDCEDFSRDMIYLFRTLQEYPFHETNNPEFKALLYLVSFYTAVTVDSVIQPETNKKSLHMYVKLIPWSFLIDRYNGDAEELEKRRKFVNEKDYKNEQTMQTSTPRVFVHLKKYMPILALESTNRVIANWTDRTLCDRFEEGITAIQKVANSNRAAKENFINKASHRLGFISTKSFLQNTNDTRKFYVWDISFSGVDLARFLRQAVVLLVNHDESKEKEQHYGVKPLAGVEYIKPEGENLLLYPYIGYTRQDTREAIRLHKSLPRTRPLILSNPKKIYPLPAESKEESTWIPLFLVPDHSVVKQRYEIEKKFIEIYKEEFGTKKTAPEPVVLHITDKIAVKMIKIYL
jgi:hypothetical protein